MRRSLATGLVCLFGFISIFSDNVIANSGPTSWEGTSGAELLSIDGDTPIEVVEENLIFDLREIADEGYTVSSWITASYEMHNTSDQAELSLMTFPMMSYNPIDRADISITVDGEAVVYQLHPHSIYDKEDRQFSNIVNDIQSDYRTDMIFNSKTEGTLWTFQPLEPSKDYQEIRLDLTFDPSKTQLIRSGFNSGQFEYGHVVLGADLKGDEQATVYYRGVKPAMELSQNALVDSRPMSFIDYYHTFIIPKINLLGQSEDGKAVTDQYNDVSLFNMLTERLQTYVYNQSSFVDTEQLVTILQGEQIVSANYEVLFEADQTRTVEVRYKVKASMKNRAYGSREDAAYTFEYFLNPAKSWLGFGRLNIDVLFDDGLWRIKDTNLSLVQSEGGYKQEYENLPDGDIFITIQSRDAEKNNSQITDKFAISHIALFIAVLILLGGGGYIALLIFIKRNKQ